MRSMRSLFLIITCAMASLVLVAILMNKQKVSVAMTSGVTLPFHDNHKEFHKTLESITYGGNISVRTTTIASDVTSTIEILGDRRVYSVGDKVKVTITLYDQLGRRKTTGGDILRLWLAEDKVKANVAGEVIDNQDGTYTGSVLLPWRGRPTIHVSIAAPQELRILILKIIKQNNGLFVPYFGLFINNKSQKELTQCGPLFPNVDRTKLCNFTQDNYGLAWYCVAPQNPELSCKDWKKIKCENIKNVVPGTNILFRDFHDRKLISSPNVTVEGGDAVMATRDTPCDRRPRQETWNTHPSGFYFNKTWNINGCRRGSTLQDEVTFRKYGRCLKNRQLILIGDSNIRSFANIFVSDLNMTIVRGTFQLFSISFAVNVYMNVSISYFPHNLPFYSSSFVSRDIFVPVVKRLDDIPAGNNSIILLHLWLHALMMDTRVFRQHVRHIRISAERMLQRAPDVDLIIKGPHATTSHKPPTDFSIQQHKRIWWEEFQGIHDKVIFLDMWDMTVGNENHKTHPPCVMDMGFIFLSHLCSI